MRDYLGEEFAGTVSSVTSFGLFVTLDAMYVEGLVHISELGGDYFRFDELRQELRGERSGMRFAIGTRLQVQVSRVDLDARRIDFRLVQEASTAAMPPQRGPGRSRAARRTAALLQQQQDNDEGEFVPTSASFPTHSPRAEVKSVKKSKSSSAMGGGARSAKTVSPAKPATKVAKTAGKKKR